MTQNSKSWRFHPLNVAGIVILVAVTLFFTFAQGSSDCSEFTAFPNARDRIRSQMHDPSSARFSNETAVSLGGCRYRVSGTVRGTNAFGGVVSEEYSVEVSG